MEKSGALLLQRSRWQIVEALSGGATSATEIAARTHSSLPNITQQLKLLAAYDIVTKDRDQKASVGKPRRLFKIRRPTAHIALARDGFAEQAALTPNNLQALLLSTLFLKNAQDQGPLLKMLLDNWEMVEKCAISYLKNSQTDIEILLLTDDVEHIRKEYSNIEVEHEGKKRKIVAWTHTLQEVRDGLAREDKHFDIFIQPHRVIHDPDNQFRKVTE